MQITQGCFFPLLYKGVRICLELAVFSTFYVTTSLHSTTLELLKFGLNAMSFKEP